jgi:hypothetical protein
MLQFVAFVELPQALSAPSGAGEKAVAPLN